MLMLDSNTPRPTLGCSTLRDPGRTYINIEKEVSAWQSEALPRARGQFSISNQYSCTELTFLSQSSEKSSNPFILYAKLFQYWNAASQAFRHAELHVNVPQI